jgi:hypothetical protein
LNDKKSAKIKTPIKEANLIFGIIRMTKDKIKDDSKIFSISNKLQNK